MRLKAFGPFSTEVAVSFDRVFDGGLFLIHGRTGAGKTSILDGLCFSLFGRPSSEEREKDIRGLRSDLADTSLMTETELIFTIGSEAYRVHRIPTQPTPKKRGEGFTEHKGSAELYRLDATIDELRAKLNEASGEAHDVSTMPWVPLAGKVEAVDAAVEALLGMNERQFRQVVILPQGKFREFLSSTSSDRQIILEKLFQTDRFSRLQQFISTRARSGETLYREATLGLQTKLESMGLASIEDIEPRKTELIAKSDVALVELTIARSQVEKQSQELSQAKEYERAHERLKQIEMAAGLLAQRGSEIDGLKTKATRGRLWLPYFNLADETQTLAKKTSGRSAARDLSLKQVAELKDKKSVASQELANLQAKKPSLEEIGTELNRLRSVAVMLKDIEKSAAAIVLDESKNLKTRDQVKLLETRAGTLSLERLSNLRCLVRIDETERGQESALLEFEDLRVKEIELKFHHSEASRLAAFLTPGAPCPVCGSKQHPQPARAASSIDDEQRSDKQYAKITEDAVRSAKLGLDQLRFELTEKRTRRHSRLEPILATLGLPLEKAMTDLDVAGLEFSRQLESFETSTRDYQTTLQTIEVQRAELNTRSDGLAVARDGLESKKKSVPERDQNYDDVVKRGTELKAEQESREPLIKHLEILVNRYDGELSRQAGILHALDQEIALMRQELAALNSKRDSLRPKGDEPARATEAELKAAEAEIETHSLQVLKNATSLGEVQKSLEHVKASRPSALIATELEVLSNLRSELEQTLARARIDIEGLVKLENETTLGIEKLSHLKTEAERAARMSALLTGDRSQNKLLVPLSRFVLQSRFEEVLEQANRRLARMSRGQFQLRRPALSRNLRDSQGLEIRVEDANAGTERHAGSLSGGESFMAALSLALGLADVVQADLGGVKLDSVLIDEGFGTLDSESLDLAMKTLVDLQAGGRLVGIISHVQEIKSQVAHRLEVTKSPQGSFALWNVSL
jgi:exonuclease SbcC